MDRTASAPNKKLILGAAAGSLLAGAVCLGIYFSSKPAQASSGAQPDTQVDRSDDSQQRAALTNYLEGSIELVFGERRVDVTRNELGALVDEDALSKTGAEVIAKLASGSSTDIAAPVSLNRKTAERRLMELKQSLDTAPVNAYLDLENRKVIGETPGRGVDIFGSVSAIEVALRRGVASVELEGVAVPPDVTTQSLGVDDISTVLGSFSTRFSVAEKTRNDNLKLLASMIDGYVLLPGQEFSFNEVTGDRTLEDGFKMAHVIQAGEMVDGMAGGSCQISTTLHGAAFFSGLDIVRSLPHSRPSTYVAMGLDATVVASRVDLKLKNPYEFPVVVHYKVARGEAVVELLGRERPFDKVEFVRDIRERIDFETITREDPKIGMGHMVVDQPGYPGYKLTRLRRVWKDNKIVRRDKWNLQYRPVIEYARLGINPDPNLPAPKEKKAHGPKPAKGKFKMARCGAKAC